MRQCPLCRRTYDDVESFCYDDGTPLVIISQSGFGSQSQPTVVLPPSQQVVVSQGASATKWIFLLLGLLIAAVGMIGFLLFTRLGSNEANRAGNTPINAVESKVLPTPETKVKSTPAPPPPKPPSRSYAATTRLKFAKGAVTTGYSGDVNANDTRSFVLACRAGQQLSASVSSGGNCVTFVSGGESYGTLTSSGDNYVTVRNGCSNAVAFRLSITII